MLATSWDLGKRAAAKLGLSTKSTLGAIVHHTGGILVDQAWLRIYGAGHPRLPRAAHSFAEEVGFDRGVLVADDAVGGFFAWFETTRTVHYLSPDHGDWENLELGYTDWLGAMLGEGLAGFYEDLRWETWREEVGALEPDQGIHVYPPLWAEGPPTESRQRKPAPMDELYALLSEMVDS